MRKPRKKGVLALEDDADIDDEGSDEDKDDDDDDGRGWEDAYEQKVWHIDYKWYLSASSNGIAFLYTCISVFRWHGFYHFI